VCAFISNQWSCGMVGVGGMVGCELVGVGGVGGLFWVGGG
jgi:hypothetical protein